MGNHGAAGVSQNAGVLVVLVGNTNVSILVSFMSVYVSYVHKKSRAILLIFCPTWLVAFILLQIRK